MDEHNLEIAGTHIVSGIRAVHMRVLTAADFHLIGEFDTITLFLLIHYTVMQCKRRSFYIVKFSVTAAS